MARWPRTGTWSFRTKCHLHLWDIIMTKQAATISESFHPCQLLGEKTCSLRIEPKTYSGCPMPDFGTNNPQSTATMDIRSPVEGRRLWTFNTCAIHWWILHYWHIIQSIFSYLLSKRRTIRKPPISWDDMFSQRLVVLVQTPEEQRQINALKACIPWGQWLMV